MRRNRGVLGSILCLLLGIVLGIVTTVGAEAVVVSHFYHNVKLEEINDKTGTEIFGSATIDGETIDLANMSLADLVAVLPELEQKTHNITIANIEELLPVIHMEKLFPDSLLSEDKSSLSISVGGATLMEIPMEEIRTHALTDFPKYVVDQVKTQVKFSVVETLGIDFSTLPFVEGTSANGTPVYNYVSLGTGEIPTFYKQNVGNICYKDEAGGYLPATAEMLSNRSTETSVPLYYKAQGLNDLPFIDAVNTLAASFDTTTMTLADLDEKFALGLKDENGNYQNALLGEIDSIPFGELASEVDTVVGNLTIADALGQEDGVPFDSFILESLRDIKIGEFDQEIGTMTLGDFIEIDENSSAILKSLKDASINDLSSEVDSTIQELTIADALGQEEGVPFESFVLESMRDIKIGEFDEKIGTMTLGEVIEIDDNSSAILKSLKDATINNLSSEVGETIKSLTIADALDQEEGVPFDSFVLESMRDIKIGEFDEKIGTMTLGEVIEIDENSSAVLKSLEDATINNLSSEVGERIKDLTLADALGQEEGVPFESHVLESMRDIKIGEFDQKIGTMTLGEVIEIDDNSSAILKSLKDATIDNLSGEVDTKIKDLTLAEALGQGDDPFDSLVLESLRDVKIGDFDTEVNSLTLGEVIEIDDNAPAVLQSLKNSTINNLSNEVDETVKNLTLADVFNQGDEPFESNALEALRDVKIGELGDHFGTLTLGEVIEINETSPAILRSLQNSTIDGLSDEIGDAVKDLTLAEAFDQGEEPFESRILETLRNTKIGNLDQEIEEIQLGDVIEIGDDSPAILKALRASKINSLSNDVDGAVKGLTLAEALSQKEGEPFASRILETMRNTKIGEFDAKIETIKLSDVIEINENSAAILKALKETQINALSNEIDGAVKGLTLAEALSQKEGEPFASRILETMRNTKIGEFDAKIETIKLSDVIEINENSAAILKALKETQINALSTEIDGAVKGLTLAEALGQKEGEPFTSRILETLRNVKIGNFDAEIETIKLSDVIEINENSAAILKTLKDAKINSLSSEIDSAVKGLTLAEALGQKEDEAFDSRILETMRNVKISEFDTEIGKITLSDVIEITSDSSPILLALKDAKVSTIGTSIDSLTLSQMVTVPSDGSFFAKLMAIDEVKNATLSTLSTAISTVQITEMFPESHDEYGNLTGIWYFLLKNNPSATISELGTIVDHAADNIAGATIGELVDKGVLTVEGLTSANGLYYYPLQELIQDLSAGNFVAIQQKILEFQAQIQP